MCPDKIKTSRTLYMHVSDFILDQILGGKWPIGSLLPSEDKLISQFNVSRNTIRKALDNLENNGYIHRLRGRGTFISSTKLNQPLIKLTSFSEDVIALGMTPDHKNICIEQQFASDFVAEKLQIPKGSEILFMCRLLLANNKPYSVTREYLPLKILNLYDINITYKSIGNGSLYKYLEDHNLKITEGNIIIRAGRVSKEDRLLLDCSLGSPVLISERVSFSGSTVIEYSLGVGHPDHHQWNAKLFRNQS